MQGSVRGLHRPTHGDHSSVQAVVDANEPPMPGRVTTEQAVKFAEALIRGQKDACQIINTVVEDKVREVADTVTS